MPIEFDPTQYTEVTTNAGAVLYCQVVPPFAQTAVHKRMPAPPLPRVEVRSASGDNVETHIALPGTPEHDAYLEAKEAYRHEFGMALQRFTITYGVVAWALRPGEGVQFDPPVDWVLPKTLVDYGVKELEGPERRAQYILYMLILTDTDLQKVESVVLPSAPVTKESVAAALAPFASLAGASQSSTEGPSSPEREQE